MTTDSIAVLFTDLVGSTALLSRLGEERAEELRREHFRLLRGSIANVGGREVKNLGDGLMVVFAASSDAFRCAIAMQQSLERRNRTTSDDPLMVRIGISFGEADSHENDYFGVPVVEAARLCAIADGGQILATELASLLAGSRAGLDLVPIGPKSLKGLPEPVAAREVKWSPLVEERDAAIPLPTRLSAPANVFVGRLTERARLTDAYKGALSGERQLMLIGGEPGIGKTALVQRFAEAVHVDGAIVLYGRSDEEVALPYRPWIEALTHLVMHLPIAVIQAHVAAREAHLVRLVPELRQRMPDLGPVPALEPEAERYLVFGSVVDLVARASLLAPIVIVLDDLHWVDKPSLQLLRHVVASADSLRLLVVGTFRSDVGLDHPLSEALAALHREPHVDRFSLRGLDDDDLLSLMESFAGHEMDDTGLVLRDALLRETDGNPFFTTEILRHLAETAAIRQDAEGRWTAAVDLREYGLPVSVREVVSQRVRRLGADAVAVLSAAAVVGRDFDLSVLCAVTSMNEDRLIDVLEGALSAGILAEVALQPGRYTFSHALIEHTLVSELTATRRTRLHRSVAEAIEDVYAANVAEHLGELARHWSLATAPIEVVKAIDYSRRAGEHALMNFAPDEAVRWFAHALDLVMSRMADDEETKCAVLVGLGEAQRQAGDAAYRRTLLDAAATAHALGDDQLLIRAALANNRGFYSAIGTVDAERVETVRRALVVAPPDSPERARLLAILALELTFAEDFDNRLALVHEAVAVARSSGDQRTIADVLARTHEAIAVPSTIADRLQWTAEACDIARALRDPALEWLANTVNMVSGLDAGDLAIVDRGLGAATSAAEKLGQPHPEWETRYHSSWRAMLAGDTALAEQLASSALDVGTESGEPDALLIFGVQLIAIRWQQGRLAEMLPLIKQGADDAPGVPGYRALYAWACAETGEIDDRACRGGRRSTRWFRAAVRRYVARRPGVLGRRGISRRRSGHPAARITSAAVLVPDREPARGALRRSRRIPRTSRVRSSRPRRGRTARHRRLGHSPQLGGAVLRRVLITGSGAGVDRPGGRRESPEGRRPARHRDLDCERARVRRGGVRGACTYDKLTTHSPFRNLRRSLVVTLVASCRSRSRSSRPGSAGARRCVTPAYQILSRELLPSTIFDRLLDMKVS